MILILGGLVILLRFIVQTWYYTANEGFAVTFGDDVWQILTSKLWAENPGALPHRLLLPLPFWLLGTSLSVLPNVLLTPVLVQSLIGAAGLLMIWKISRELFPGHDSTALLAMTVAAFHPASILFSMGATQTPLIDLAVLSGAFLFLKFQRTKNNRFLVGASISFALGTMVHFDGWMYALVFSILLLWQIVGHYRAHHKLPWEWLILLGLPWIFVSYWILLQTAVHGTPLAHYYSCIAVRPLFDSASRLGMPAIEFTSRFPVVLILAIVGTIACMRQKIGVRASYLAFAVGETALTIPLYAVGVMLPFCHYTHLWTSYLLIIPLAAMTLLWFPEKIRKWITVAAVIAIVAFNLSVFSRTASSTTNFSASIIRTGHLIRSLWSSGMLRGEDRVLVETHDNEMQGHVWEIQALFLANPPTKDPYERTWDPPYPSDRILLDRAFRYKGQRGALQIDTEGNPSSLERPVSALFPWLKQNDVRLVIAHKTGTIEKLRNQFVEIARLPPYVFLADAEDEALQRSVRDLAQKAADMSLPWRKGS